VREFLQSFIGWAVLATVPVVGLWVINKFYAKKINRRIEGYFFHKDRQFDLDDEVIVDGVMARMVRFNHDDTTFYLYTYDPELDIVIFADRLTVSNDKLRDLKITEQIPNHSRPKKVKPISV
jgi:hypothetical protein